MIFLEQEEVKIKIKIIIRSSLICVVKHSQYGGIRKWTFTLSAQKNLPQSSWTALGNYVRVIRPTLFACLRVIA